MRAAAFATSLALLVGCAPDLLPGELVVPGELPAEFYRGAPGAGLGAAVALDDGRLLAGAPGSGEAWVLPGDAGSVGPRGLGGAVWWSDGVPWAARVTEAVYRVDGPAAERVWLVPGARILAAGALAGEGRVVGSDGTRVWIWDQAGELQDEIVQPGVQRLAVGAARVLILACAGGACQVLAWPAGSVEVEVLGEAGDGGALVEYDGVAWWGLPALDDPSAPGEVCAEGGTCIAGIAGDHLGRSLCAGYAAGVGNTVAVPSRLRLVPLDGGTVLALDRAAPGRPAALDCDPDRIAVGLATTGLHEPGEGVVMVIARP
ncbi:MAG: hypothetical protein ABIO70_05600 [Pseudomonadota bacterium]